MQLINDIDNDGLSCFAKKTNMGNKKL